MSDRILHIVVLGPTKCCSMRFVAFGESLCTVAGAAAGSGACLAENNECIMWNGFLPHCERGEQ